MSTPNPMTDGVLLPGSIVGVIGGGQLGRMFVMAARRLGYRTVVLDPSPDAPAAQLADAAIHAPLNDAEAARELARRVDVVTLEWENADVAALRALEQLRPVRPGPHVLEICQHRVREKDAVRRLGISTAGYRAVSTRGELEDAARTLGLPLVLKTARGGYDGKGQVVVRAAEEFDAAFDALAPAGDLIAEAMVRFRMEVSAIVARGPDGEMAVFPVAENLHRNGILDTTLVPAPLDEAQRGSAARIARTLAEGLNVVGVLAVEMFVTETGELLVNELAPRPHNSGHFSIEACATSQFEQQLRAVCGLPLGSTALQRPAAMVNLLGEDGGTGFGNAGVADALATPGAVLHLYGKTEARPGRKMGHITALGADTADALSRARVARQRLRGHT